MDSRIFTPFEFYGHLPRAVRAMPTLARSQRRGLIIKAFREKIMLAVTRVNGCRYCSWFHTRVAIKEGISKTEIHSLLGGKFEDADEDEMLALIYAQHYADTVGSIYGIAFNGLMRRLKVKKMKGSKLHYELGIVFGSLLMFPVAMVHGLIS